MTGWGRRPPGTRRDARGALFARRALESPHPRRHRNGDYRLVQLLASRGADARAAEALRADA